MKSNSFVVRRLLAGGYGIFDDSKTMVQGPFWSREAAKGALRDREELGPPLPPVNRGPPHTVH